MTLSIINETQHNNTHHKDIQHKGLIFETQHNYQITWLVPYFIKYSLHFLHWKWWWNIPCALYTEGSWERV